MHLLVWQVPLDVVQENPWSERQPFLPPQELFGQLIGNANAESFDD